MQDEKTSRPEGEIPSAGAVHDGRARRTLLITGATGFLGSNFVLTHAARFDHVVAIVRASSSEQARQRVLAQLELAARHRLIPFLPESWSDRLSVLAGDVALPYAGLDLSMLEGLLNDSQIHVWHFAATLEYEERHRKSIEATNVDGTRHMLEIFARLRGARFVHVSTAYVAGTSTGEIPEQLVPEGREFNNAYEESKCRAEWDVASFCTERGADYRILRPAIVVGPLRNHRTGGSDSGLYGFVRLLHRMRESLRAIPDGASIIGQPETPVHLTPVDSFCVDAEPLLLDEPGPQRVFHAVTPGSITGMDLQSLLAEELDLPVLQLVREREQRPAPIERLLDRVMALYGVAVRHPKMFVRAVPSVDHVSRSDARAYIRECVKELEGNALEDLWHVRSLASHDGSPLVTYSAGPQNAPCVVLLNAFGMNVPFFRALGEQLRGSHRVLTWDSRGIPSFGEEFPEQACDVTAHARDLESILKAEGVRGPVHVVGWCTGAQVALRFHALQPQRVRSLTLLNGAFSFPESVGVTEFKRNIMYLMPRVAQSREHAKAYHRMLYGQRGSNNREDRAADADRAQVERTLLSSDQLVQNLTSSPFKDPESLYRYAKLVMHLVREPEHVWAEHISAPVLVLSGAHDTVAHPEESREIARRIPHAELVIGESWNHFSLLHDADFAARVLSFITQVEDSSQREGRHVLAAQAT